MGKESEKYAKKYQSRDWEDQGDYRDNVDVNPHEMAHNASEAAHENTLQAHLSGKASDHKLAYDSHREAVIDHNKASRATGGLSKKYHLQMANVHKTMMHLHNKILGELQRQRNTVLRRLK